MKISESITKLQEILQTAGDVEVIALTDIDGAFVADFDLIFEAIDLPNEDETGFETVCALMEDPVDESHTRAVDLKIVRPQE